jgi:hypothetical protein
LIIEYPLTTANKSFYLIAGMIIIESTAEGCLGSYFTLRHDFIFNIVM